jgi:hypothetical protein
VEEGNMECKYKETLMMYFYGELDESRKEEMSKHLSECSQCQFDFNILKNVSEFLNVTQAEPSPGVISALMQKAQDIRKEFSVTDVYEFLKIRWREMALTLACASILVVSIKITSPVKNGNFAWTSNIESKLDSIEYDIYETRDDFSEELLSDFDFKYIKLKSEIKNTVI